MTPALAYMRCSGRGQIDGDTWDRQESAIRAYAESHDIEIIAWYRDEGISGKTELENRPGLAACLERIEHNGVKLVLVESADRLARDSMVSEIIIREFQKAGGEIIASSGVNLTAGDDANPTAALIRGVLALIAEFDRRVTVLKLRAARDRIKAKTGRCEGRPPFGSTAEERLTLDEILRLDREENLTCLQIANYLNARNVPAPRGGKWHAGTISKIIARENRKTGLGESCTLISQQA